MKNFNLYLASLFLLLGCQNATAMGCEKASGPKVFDPTEPAIAEELDCLDYELKRCERHFGDTDDDGRIRSLCTGPHSAEIIGSHYWHEPHAMGFFGGCLRSYNLHRALRTEKEFENLSREAVKYFKADGCENSDLRKKIFQNMLEIDKRIAKRTMDDSWQLSEVGKESLYHTTIRPYTKCIAAGGDRTVCRKALAEGVNKSLAAAYAAERDAH